VNGAWNSQLPEAPPPQEPPPTPQQAGSVTIAPQYGALLPGESLQLTAQVGGKTGPVQWLVDNITGGNSAAGVIDGKGNYTAPSVPLSTNVIIPAQQTTSPQQNYATAVVTVINTGQLTPTPNPQVVAYSIYLSASGSVSVQFGHVV